MLSLVPSSFFPLPSFSNPPSDHSLNQSSKIAIWKGVKPWLDERTLAKIEICGYDDFLDALQLEVDLDQIPEIYGGKYRFNKLSLLKKKYIVSYSFLPVALLTRKREVFFVGNGMALPKQWTLEGQTLLKFLSMGLRFVILFRL